MKQQKLQSSCKKNYVKSFESAIKRQVYGNGLDENCVFMLKVSGS